MNLKRLISFEKYLNKLNARKCRFGEDTDEDLCAICLENFNGVSQNEICINHCSHKFHCVCIQGWVNMPGPAKTCPICRKNITIVTPNNIVPADDNEIENNGIGRFPRRNLMDEFNRAANNGRTLRRSYTYQE